MSFIIVPEPDTGAFGEAIHAQLTPKIQLDFGYNINTDIVNTTLTGSGTVTQSDSKAVLQTTANASSSASFSSQRISKYRPGQGGLVRFTALFTAGAANSTQIIGLGDSADRLAFAFNGTTFSVLTRQDSVDTFVAQTSWSDDKGDATGILPVIDHTKGNVFAIRYQWLGFGMIQFYMENPATGKFIRVHKIEYANANTVPSIFNPSLPLFAEVVNTSNATNIKMETSSMAAFVEGLSVILGPKNSKDNTKTSVGTTETNILTIRNKTTFASKTNRVGVELSLMAAAVDGTKPAICRVIKNTTLGGTPSYTDISTNTSVMDFDVAGTTITGGKVLFTFPLAKAGNVLLLTKELNIEIDPGDTITISAEATSGTTDATVGFSWVEDF
jgi:hypothetical protein